MGENQTFYYYKCTVCSAHFLNECHFLTHARDFHCKVLVNRGYNIDSETAFHEDVADMADCVKSEFSSYPASGDCVDGDSDFDTSDNGGDNSAVTDCLSISFTSKTECTSDSSAAVETGNMLEWMTGLTAKAIDTQTGHSACDARVNTPAAQQEIPQVNETGRKANRVHCEETLEQTCFSEVLSDQIAAYSETHRRKDKPPFLCKFCGKEFRNVYNRNRHECIHTGTKPYKCSVCCKGFIESGALKRHMRMHSGEKPHECFMCHKRFSQLGHMKTHMRRTHWRKATPV